MLNCHSDLTFFVGGTPIPQGSKRAFVRGGRVSLVEANPKLPVWRAAVKLACQQAMLDVQAAPGQDVPFLVELDFVLPRPKTVKRAVPSVKPDVDKLIRAVLDSVTHAGFWTGDELVVEVTAKKRYAPTEFDVGAWIRLRHAENK